MARLVKINESTGYFESDKSEFIGLWFNYLKDADILSHDKSPLTKLLHEVKSKGVAITQPHFDAIEFDAIGVGKNEFKDTIEELGYVITFDWSRLIARKFSNVFPKNTLLFECLYSGIGTEAMFLYQEVFKPKGISTDKFVSYIKVICSKCYNVLDDKTLDNFIVNELADLTGTKTFIKQESCCPNCNNNISVTGILNLSAREAEALKKRGWGTKENISVWQDPRYNYKTYNDNDNSVLGAAKIMKFYEEDLEVYMNLSMDGVTLYEKKPASSNSKGCLLFVFIIVFIILILN